MNPVEFEGQNVVFAKDQPEYLPLPALVLPDASQAITCWELTDDELRQLVGARSQGKKPVIWLTQLIFGQPLQPQRPSVEMPFTIEEPKEEVKNEP